VSPPEARTSPSLPSSLILALAVTLAAVELLIFWPGVVTPDSLSQYGQALSGRYEDWHPPVMAFLWRQLGWLAPGQAPFLVMDALLYWGGAGLLADALRRHGRPRSALAILAVAAMPIPLGQMGAILKDSLMLACCMAAAGLAAQGGRTARLVALGLLVIAAATRFNAAFAVGPLLIWLLPLGWTKGTIRHGGLVLVAIALLSISSWLIDQVALAPHRTHPMASLVGFDLAGIIAQGGEATIPPLSGETSRRLTALCYRPAQFNPTYRDDCDDAQSGLSRATAGRLMRFWLEAVSRHPLPWLRHRLVHLDINWRFLVAKVPDDAIYIMTTPANALGLSYRPSPAAMADYRLASVLAASPLGRPATWLTVAAALLMLASSFRCRRAVIALASSALLYGGAYGVVSVAPDLRYNVWTMLAAALALAIASRDLANVPRRRLAWGGAAVSGVMLLEAAWMIFPLPSPI
jgi:hypothetical protein